MLVPSIQVGRKRARFFGASFCIIENNGLEINYYYERRNTPSATSQPRVFNG